MFGLSSLELTGGGRFLDVGSLKTTYPSGPGHGSKIVACFHLVTVTPAVSEPVWQLGLPVRAAGMLPRNRGPTVQTSDSRPERRRGTGFVFVTHSTGDQAERLCRQPARVRPMAPMHIMTIAWGSGTGRPIWKRAVPVVLPLKPPNGPPG